MKILVIGAAGKTGAAVVDQALAAGHSITAFVHEADFDHNDAVRVITGDALDPAKISEAVAGQDAVIDTLGGKTPYKETTLERDVAHGIIAAMQQHGVRRLLIVSALGVGDSKANASFVYEHLLLPTFLRGSTKDKAAMEAEVSTSHLDWTIVRPAILTDDDAVGSVRIYTAADADTAHKISRQDVARFLLDELPRNTYFGQTVTIATT